MSAPIPADLMARANRAQHAANIQARKLLADRLGAGDSVERAVAALATKREAFTEDQRAIFALTHVKEAAEAIPIWGSIGAARHGIADPLRQALAILKHDSPTPFKRYAHTEREVLEILERRFGETTAAEQSAAAKNSRTGIIKRIRSRFSQPREQDPDWNLGE